MSLNLTGIKKVTPSLTHPKGNEGKFIKIGNY